MTPLFRLKPLSPDTALDELIEVLSDTDAESVREVARRCEALEAIASLGFTARTAVSAILRTLVARVGVDCGLFLRVAAAKALWQVEGGRSSLVLPFLTWALKDEDFGVCRNALEALREMGNGAHAAIPELVQLTNRRLASGPFPFEEFESDCDEPVEPLLVIIARTLGRCSRGLPHWREAREALTRLASSPEENVRAAATEALSQVRTSDL